MAVLGWALLLSCFPCRPALTDTHSAFGSRTRHTHLRHPARASLRACRLAGTVPTFEAAVAAVEKIRFYAGDVCSRTKMHITVGHVTGGWRGGQEGRWGGLDGAVELCGARVGGAAGVACCRCGG